LKKYFIVIVFYIIGSILVSIPVILAFHFETIGFFSYIKDIFIFKFNLLTIILFIIFFIILILADSIAINNQKVIKNNIRNIELLLGGKNNIFLNFVLCIFTGFFEETAFRGLLFSFFNIIIKLFLSGMNSLILSILLVSIIFALFHITQGWIGLVMSFIISVLFFVSIIISKTIWYAVIIHFLFNFIELSFVLPYQKKNLLEKEITVNQE
jgi:membrane protease YdiL (CAAX protease family)